MTNEIISARGLSKSYLLGHNKSNSEGFTTFRDELYRGVKGVAQKTLDMFKGNSIVEGDEVEEFWALRDVSFDIKAGDSVGVIGRNGAGKSTLLKILSRITEPTSGEVRLRGRVASLLEVGTGFHPELSGRENIYLNGAILGMSRNEIRRKFDEIVDFAEVERFLDTPVKRYSSGMYVRLAFAVAAHLEPEILVVDEVLAVGDAAFQKKCLGKMGSVAAEGRTVIFVSHNMGAISELCNRGILLQSGRLVDQGPVARIVEEYVRIGASSGGALHIDIKNAGNETFITSICILNSEGVEETSFDVAEEICIEVGYQVNVEEHGLQLAVTLFRNQVDILHTFDTDQDTEIPTRSPGKYRAVYRIPGMRIKAGNYMISVDIGTPQKLIKAYHGALCFEVEERTLNTLQRGFKLDRPGHLITLGSWETRMVGES
jgi:lipopolysaccharide transport system ATP-binding protein